MIVILPEKSKGLLVFSPPTVSASNVLDFDKLYVLSKSNIAFKSSLSSTESSPSAYHFSIAFANCVSKALPRLLTPRLPDEPLPNLILIFCNDALLFISLIS